VGVLPRVQPAGLAAVRQEQAGLSGSRLAGLGTIGTPTAIGVLPDVDIGARDIGESFPNLVMLISTEPWQLERNYAARLTGSLNVEAEADYELCLVSDDGSRLLLEGVVVIENDGVKDVPTQACSTVHLAPGEYGLEIRYFQAEGPTLALQLSWSIDGGAKAIVPSAALFRPAA
jgi:hypothetical protein